MASNLPDQEMIRLVPHTVLNDCKEVIEYEEQQVSLGYEGIMLRSLDGKYKFGRSTVREGILSKLKRFSDGEATIISVEPLQRNLNGAEKDELGYSRRSSHKANKMADELAGHLIVSSPEYGEFSIGSGFDELTRSWLWEHREEIKGRLITYKYQKVGLKDVPRFPIYKGFRTELR